MHYILKMKQTLEQNYHFDQTLVERHMKERNNGKQFSLNDHVRALIYSLLSNQRRWTDLEQKLKDVDDIFFNYDAEEIQKKPSEYFYQKITDIKAGNRQIKKQLEGLSYNIDIFKKIELEFGTIDKFVLDNNPTEVVKLISQSKSKYKLKQVGVALAWEYVRNVGVDGAKPDIHLRRFLGSGRMGISKKTVASEKEVSEQVEKMSADTGLSRTAIDAIIWQYCSKGNAEICGETPQCGRCCCRDECKYQKNL